MNFEPSNAREEGRGITHQHALQDREMILQSIQDVKRFNSDLQWTIFGTEGMGFSATDQSRRVFEFL